MRSWLLFLALASVAAVAVEPAGVERTVLVMGTELRLSVEAADRAAALRASEAALRAVEAAEARLSTWRPDTELARLNRAPVGAKVRLSETLASELQAAWRCSEATAGAFDPTLGALVEAWGLRRGGQEPPAVELERARAASGVRLLELGRRSATRRRAGVRVEEGGFGKGVALAAASSVLRAEPGVLRASLDLGGQLVVLGEDATWSVALADPRNRARAVVGLQLERGSVSTSGNAERGIEIGAARWSHLLDPRSGLPVHDFGSLTVWTADPVRADCLSTGLYVLGPERALSWALEQPDVEVLVLEPRGTDLLGRATPGLAPRLRPLVPELSLQVVAAGRTAKTTPNSRRAPALEVPATNRGRRVPSDRRRETLRPLDTRGQPPAHLMEECTCSTDVQPGS